MSQKVEKVPQGGAAQNIKKSKIRNLDFLIRAGGGYIFIFFPNVNIDFREAFQLKNVPKSGKSPKGGGVSKKHQKVQNSKFGLFDKRGGRPYFHFFPKFKCSL